MIKVHIKINTGMNRIGLKYNEIDKIEEIYRCNNIKITGIYSHLAVADEKERNSTEFTKKQIEKFNICINSLKEKGYDTGKVHIQNSYGILNYNECNFKYVRTGLFLYGVKEDEEDNFELKPVLELKSRIESINKIKENETVGYGRSYKSQKEEKIVYKNKNK